MTASPARTRRAPTRRTVDLGTNRGIGDAADLRDQLLALLGRKAAVTLDASQLERVDTATLQVLLAFVRKAEGRGITVKWKGPSDAARAAMDALGVSSALGVSADASR